MRKAVLVVLAAIGLMGLTSCEDYYAYGYCPYSYGYCHDRYYYSRAYYYGPRYYASSYARYGYRWDGRYWRDGYGDFWDGRYWRDKYGHPHTYPAPPRRA